MPPPADPFVTISHPDRVVFPGTGITKGDLADYYRQIAPLILATLAGRPLSLVRCPDGIAGECFFQKHGTGNLGRLVGTVSIREKNGKQADYLCLKDARGLLECVQMGAIEFHAWGSHASNLEQPDRMVFDLDPDTGLRFAEVRKAALDINRRLAALGLISFAMLSGGKGIHVIVPLRPERDWDAVTAFARGFAQEMAAAEPDRFVATMSKARRKGRIFIDWLRNQRGSTAIMPYSVRARDGAPVAAPVTWPELAKLDTAAAFHLPDRERLLGRAQHNALAGWGQASQGLPQA
ncbi:MAG: ligase [Pseudomonadota bacterium]